MEALLGPLLLTDVTGTKKETATLLKDKDVVGLYFSASWCPPCQAFTPKLIEFYNHQKQRQQKSKGDDDGEDDGKSSSSNVSSTPAVSLLSLEIIYVASDRSVESFQGYYGRMPWLAIPGDRSSLAIKEKLANTFCIRGIPSLILLDAKTGNYIVGTKSAAIPEVQCSYTDPSKVQMAIQSWKRTESIPLEQAAAQLAQANVGGGAGGLLQAIAKSPVMLFATVYGIRFLVQFIFKFLNTNPQAQLFLSKLGLLRNTGGGDDLFDNTIAAATMGDLPIGSVPQGASEPEFDSEEF